jgi:hypothetical protein
MSIRWLAAAVPCLVSIVLAPPASAQSRDAGIVRGRVVERDGGAPVRKARVALTPAGASSAEPIYTNGDGEFEFDSVAPGTYTLEAMKSGYVPARFGARGPFDRTTNVAVIGGAIVDAVQLRLVKGAALAGRIVDESGDPVTGALVSAGRLVKTDGRLQFKAVGTPIDTDDLGEYRIAGLAAGDYALAISPAGGGMAPRSRQTFYPGTPYLIQARVIPLHAGETANATDVALLPHDGTLIRLSGYAADAAGTPASGKLTVVTTGDGVAASTSARSVQLSPTGEFEVETEPGNHTLIAQSERGIALQRLYADSDVGGLRLAVRAGARLAGRVIFNGVSPPPAPAVRVEAWNADFGGATAYLLNPAGGASPVKPDGTFVLENVVGRRELRVSNVPQGWFVASIVHEGRNLLNVPLELEGGADVSGVQIVLTDKPTELNGLVVDREQRAIFDCSVLVFAEDRTLLPGRARWVHPDSSARFVVEGLPAGTYFAVAVADVDDVEWATAEYLDRFRDAAYRPSRVTLADGETKTVLLEWPGTP